MRIGQGYDVHRLAEGRKMILGGVEIPADKGPLGHSDADVLLHAICDALLGAIGLGDIGKHFPDTDQAYKNISSLILLEKVNALITERNYRVGNVDATLVLQKPKIALHVPAMKKNIAAVLHVEEERVSIKATTSEGLGFVGAGDGVVAYAVALVFKS
ncbi:MAG TPA: 2-C-methyl-D-erythritol 2,4-cyclodiphosphate synthase [bacterium]|nr:2-C-methyl-D-erythritol 2,4-cyclodiphosphate synthase [bacterium]HMZ04145.1 2-C-methyl-D-erythritol 2,4-cyclodiphosphate synthase [bacterium]HND78697.1 2-C-methyl-D-erythritol 2,4-cyclodiphosphate synthase [bacterium]HNE84262.1 2-C-methyl-D-erythritol 2,4-cyclodiphosphate synthase [bacterium]HNI10936.1 2-C-methyl-D-erythritol 2,4-cyclodiphosphate synthase [bacterium]